MLERLDGEKQPRVVAAAVAAAREAEKETVRVEQAVAGLPSDARLELLQAEELAILAQAIADRMESTTPRHPGKLSLADKLLATYETMPQYVGSPAAVQGEFAPPFVFLRVGAGDKADELAASGSKTDSGVMDQHHAAGPGLGRAAGGGTPIPGAGDGREALPAWEGIPASDPSSHGGPLAIESKD